eukprot:6189803-Pleurochrysis_carterae.AAC.3
MASRNWGSESPANGEDELASATRRELAKGGSLAGWSDGVGRSGAEKRGLSGMPCKDVVGQVCGEGWERRRWE